MWYLFSIYSGFFFKVININIYLLNLKKCPVTPVVYPLNSWVDRLLVRYIYNESWDITQISKKGNFLSQKNSEIKLHKVTRVSKKGNYFVDRYHNSGWNYDLARIIIQRRIRQIIRFIRGSIRHLIRRMTDDLWSDEWRMIQIIRR